MRLSPLQRHILKQALEEGRRVSRTLFFAYYDAESSASREQLRGKIITHSLERLIDRGYLTGYGHRTAEKWFIDMVELTALGRRQARLLIAQQQTLPLRRKPGRKPKSA